MAIILTHRDNNAHAEIRYQNQKLREELNKVKQQMAPPEGAHLVVNGQVRKIGKKSQYLLDMLTLPED
jgi:hypothetical protein